MNAGAQSPILKKSELFERLALGRSAAVTVVTPNKRLSRALMLEFDAFQIGKALSVWEAPDILPFGAFVQRLYDDGRYADLSAELPMLVVAYAFDILPPQTRDFLDALGTEIAFSRPDPRSATVSRAAFDSAKREIEAAAQWARARLEAGGKRIGVVIPSLQEDRKEVARVFSRVMRPGGEKAAMPFNISIGIPLERYPVVALALSVLR